ncbi:hypothetical protein Dsin_000351 [Dipteronia sinensis]|uniref:GDSL esterase/lipase n=1 Tax=Dipteronia sinensis TaxID=43782 RepID=A0AAE0B399_9ROSI|nr:hypothetical protein Dsin_000351 [Dipteronia sinensis]
MDLRRIKGLGVEKVLVTAVEPIGCLPSVTAQNSHQKCDEFFNSASQFHNRQLKDAVNKLNTDTNIIHNSTASSFIILDTYKAFMSALNEKHFKGDLQAKNPLEPCCVGLDGNSCGSVDDKGVRKYSVCKNPELSFFWDDVHPTQSAWHAVSSSLNSTLHQIYKSFH